LKEQIEQFPNHRIIDAKTLARKAGNMRAANIVLIGATSDLLPFEDELIEEVIRDLFARKGERIVQMNIDAYHYGKEAINQQV